MAGAKPRPRVACQTRGTLAALAARRRHRNLTVASDPFSGTGAVVQTAWAPPCGTRAAPAWTVTAVVGRERGDRGDAAMRPTSPPYGQQDRVSWSARSRADHEAGCLLENTTDSALGGDEARPVTIACQAAG